jgi:hypothetical protein
MIDLVSAAKETGIYTIPEAARYAKMHGKSLRNWFTAFRYKGQEVILTPKVHFGEPAIGENGYTAMTLYKAALAHCVSGT